VYGRSIGGIAASHLVNKFPKIMRVFIGDRTLGDVESILINKAINGKALLGMYRLLSCKWRANNSDGFLKDSNCYKIHCFDEADDVIDIFSSHHHEIAKHYSSINYNTLDWGKFYESLKFTFSIENEIFSSIEELKNHDGRKVVTDLMYKLIDKAEDILN